MTIGIGPWTLVGTPFQNGIVLRALEAATFPWDRLVPGLQNQTGRTSIPVDWQDLSRYSMMLAKSMIDGKHPLIHENGETGHPIEVRNRVLGLAWYSGRVTIDSSLESNPELAMEVFMCEGAHMVDFFYMTPEMRTAINSAFHGGELTPHGHDEWFDDGNYYDWPGESFMIGFTRAFSSVVINRDDFTHKSSAEVVAVIRQTLDPQPQTEPQVFRYAGYRRSKVYHRIDVDEPSWRWILNPPDELWTDPPDGRRPCRICKPL